MKGGTFLSVNGYSCKVPCFKFVKVAVSVVNLTNSHILTDICKMNFP